MANIAMSVATNVARYLAEPVIREVQYFLCVNKVINDLENEKEVLTSERDNLLIRVAQAKERTEVIETPVEKWLNDVENLLKEAEDLIQRMDKDNNCFQGWFPTWRRYLLCKKMAEKTEAMEKFKGKSNNIQPFSHRAPLPGIQYQSSENFTYFESTKVAYNQLMEALQDDCIYMIGVHGMGGCGKTTLVTEAGKKVEELNMFDKVILITVSQTPIIRDIQGRMADILNLKLEEESEEGRAQRLWLCLKEKKRLLVIVDDLWRKFNLMDIGIHLDNVNKGMWKILVTTRDRRVFSSMDCQKNIHVGLLSEDESWTLFQKRANIDDKLSESFDGVPRKLCNKCRGLPIAIITVGSSLKGKHETEWELALDKLRDSDAFDDHEEGVIAALSCLELSYKYLQNKEAELLFLMCSTFPEDYNIPIEYLILYAIGLEVGGRSSSLKSTRNLIQAGINKLLDSYLLMHGEYKEHVKMHDMVREAALWIAKRSENRKILVNVDKPLSTLVEDDSMRDCFVVSSWWYNENPIFQQLHAPNLKMLLLNNASRSWNSFDLSHLTFEGTEGLKVFSLTHFDRYSRRVPLLLPPSIQLLTNVRTLCLSGWNLDDISFIAGLTRIEVLDLKNCTFNELPSDIGKLKRLKLLDLSYCYIVQKNYNGAIGKCSQLEEFYVSLRNPEEYVHEIIVDIGTLPNLQRFKIGTFSGVPKLNSGKSTRFLRVRDFNISKLRASKKNILQIAEDVVFEGLHKEFKNFFPDMVGVVGGMNDLATLCLCHCSKMECIFDTASDSKVDDWLPRLVKLELREMENLKELCRGPPRYFEKLEILDIQDCLELHSIFPSECNLQNLKILRMANCSSDTVLFPTFVAQSLHQLEELTIRNCKNLKHIIAARGREHYSNTSEEIVPAPRNSHFLMPSLRKVYIMFCTNLESILPIYFVEGLARLQEINIEDAFKLKYVFGECDNEHHSSHHIMLPHLEVLELKFLPNLVGMWPECYDAKWPSQSLRILTLLACPELATAWIALMEGSEERQHHLNEIIPSKLQEFHLADFPLLSFLLWVGPTPGQIWSFQCLQHLAVNGCRNLKSLFFMGVYISLPELMSLSISCCEELEQIVTTNEELVQLPNTEVFFPKLKAIAVGCCDKLKSLFPIAMVRMLPQLSTLHISEATQLEEVFRHGSGDNVINEMEIVLPNLTQVNLDELSSFVDICQGVKLQAVKLQILRVYKCPKIASSLRAIQVIQEETEEDDDEDSLIDSDLSDISKDVEELDKINEDVCNHSSTN